MKKRYRVIESETRNGICTSPYKTSHAQDFHLHQVKVIDVKTGEILWFCNKCIAKLGYRNTAHKLTTKDKPFWLEQTKGEV